MSEPCCDSYDLDSVHSAAPESDPTEAVGTRKVLTDLLSLDATILAIDHVSKASMAKRSVGSSPSPLGSVAKENIMRAGFFMEQRQDGVILLHHAKSTFGRRLAAPMTFRATITEDAYTLAPVAEGRTEPPSADNRLTRVLPLLAGHSDGVTSETVAARGRKWWGEQ